MKNDESGKKKNDKSERMVCGKWKGKLKTRMMMSVFRRARGLGEKEHLERITVGDKDKHREIKKREKEKKRLSVRKGEGPVTHCTKK